MDHRDSHFGHSQQESYNTKAFPEIFINGGATSPLDDPTDPQSRISLLKGARLKSVDDSVNFTLQDFPALAGNDNQSTPNGLYSTNIASREVAQNPLGNIGLMPGSPNLLNINSVAYSRHARPTKTQPFIIQKEDFPALSQNNDQSYSSLSNSSSRGLEQLAQDQNRGLANRFGILGLPKNVQRKSTRPEDALFSGSFLGIGSDMSLLALDSSSSDKIYGSFEDPFYSKPTNALLSKGDPLFSIPKEYLEVGGSSRYGAQLLPTLSKDLKKASLSGLFFMFYSGADDLTQLAATQELYSRGWMFHIELKLWFTLQTAVGGSAQHYVCFDRKTWKRKLYPDVPPGNPDKMFLKSDQINPSNLNKR